MQPADVDVVGPQPAQRVLQLLDDRLAAGAAAVRIAGTEVPEELGAEHDLVADARPAGKVVADDDLGVAVGVDVGRVHRVATLIQVGRQDLRRLLRAGTPAEILTERHRAERERADAQAAAAERHIGSQ